MVYQKSIKASKLDIRLTEGVKGVKSGLYKSSYEAIKVLGLNRDTLTRRVKGGYNCT
jgi:hypothetical protein